MWVRVVVAENLAWVEGLEQATAEIAARRESRVVLVRGAGRAFCAGLGGGAAARDRLRHPHLRQ